MAKPAIIGVDPGDEIQNWAVFGCQHILLRCEQGSMEEWSAAIIELRDYYADKGGIIVVIEDYRLYPKTNTWYKPLLTAESLGAMKWILRRENISYVLQGSGEIGILDDNWLRVRGLYIKNRHFRSAIKHAMLYIKRKEG